MFTRGRRDAAHRRAAAATPIGDANCCNTHALRARSAQSKRPRQQRSLHTKPKTMHGCLLSLSLSGCFLERGPQRWPKRFSVKQARAPAPSPALPALSRRRAQSSSWCFLEKMHGQVCVQRCVCVRVRAAESPCAGRRARARVWWRALVGRARVSDDAHALLLLIIINSARALSPLRRPRSICVAVSCALFSGRSC